MRAKNDAENALGQNVRAVGQRDTEKTHVMTAAEYCNHSNDYYGSHTASYVGCTGWNTTSQLFCLLA